MTPIRRLSLCLLALVLLSGAALQASMASPFLRDAIATSSAAASGDCHGAMSMQASADAGSDQLPHSPGPDATSAGGCCGEASGAGGCGDACPCPTALTALPHASAHADAPALAQRWQAERLGDHDRFYEGPPRRPPIG